MSSIEQGQALSTPRPMSVNKIILLINAAEYIDCHELSIGTTISNKSQKM